MSDTITQPKTDAGSGSRDPEKFAHLVRKRDQMPGYMGEVIEALCGKRWVPTEDPKRYPICPTCKEIRESAGGPLPQT